MIAAARITPELEIEHGEAKALAEAIANVAKFYPIVSGGMSPEGQAWWALATVAGGIYGVRLAPLAVEKLGAKFFGRNTEGES